MISIGTVTYVGEYKYGEFHGKGKYTCSKNGYEFEGIYFEGRVRHFRFAVFFVLLPIPIFFLRCFRNMEKERRSLETAPHMWAASRTTSLKAEARLSR